MLGITLFDSLSSLSFNLDVLYLQFDDICLCITFLYFYNKIFVNFYFSFTKVLFHSTHRENEYLKDIIFSNLFFLSSFFTFSGIFL